MWDGCVRISHDPSRRVEDRSKHWRAVMFLLPTTNFSYVYLHATKFECGLASGQQT